MLYDFKDKNLCQDVIVQSYYDVVDDIEENFENIRQYEWISVFAPADIIKEIYDCLIVDVDFTDAEYSSPELLYSDKELLLTIDFEGLVCVECARTSSGDIIRDEAVISYVYDSFTSKEVERISRGELCMPDKSVLVFGYEDDEEVDSDSVSERTYLLVSFENGMLKEETWCKDFGTIVSKIADIAQYNK